MQHPKSLFLEDLLGSKIVTAEGKTIGHVVDIRITHGREYIVTALVFGQHGWLYRWHVLHSLAEKFGLRIEPNTIPWDVVERFECCTVTLKPGYEPKRKGRWAHPHLRHK